MLDKLLQLAKKYAEDNMNPVVSPAHLLRASLHKDFDLPVFFETTLSKDYYYLVEWSEAQMAGLDKGVRVSDPQLAPESESVIREAENYMQQAGLSDLNILCVVASLVTPGVGFSFEQLKTFPVSANEIVPYINPASNGASRTKANKSTGTSNAKVLSKYCIDLTAQDDSEKSPVIGFEEELMSLYETLGRKRKSNVLILGDSGVGKTSLIRAFTNSIVAEEAPVNLKYADVFELNCMAITSGATYKGEVEDRAREIFSQLSAMERVVLVIESVDKLFDKQELLYGLLGVMKQYIDSSCISIIGTSTIEGYTKSIEKDKEFTSKIERISLEPPAESQCLRIVKGSIDGYTEYHNLSISDDVIKEAIRLAKRYIAERPMPDSVFDLIDRTMSQVCTMNDISQAEIAQYREKLDQYGNEASADATGLSWLYYEIFNKTSCLLTSQLDDDTEFDKIESTSEKIKYLRGVVDRLSEIAGTKRTEVLSSDLSSVVSKLTGVPMGKVQAKERDKLVDGENILRRRVIGQDHAIKVVLNAVYESRSGLNKKGQPLGSFFFLGPTGTGKTELSKSLVEFLFGDENALIRFDMSEFKEEHSVALLYGAPPGYVGYEEGGLLVNKIRQNPYSVVLFDEIEKAHKSVFDLFLQILDEGKLHDRLGKVGDFSNALILFTSNIGSQFIVDSFNSGHIPQGNELMDLMQGHFRPEFLGRLTEIVPFAPISEQTVVRIFDIHLQNLCKQLAEQHITLSVDEECKREIALNGFNSQYGARPIIGIIRKELRRPLATQIITGKIKSGDTVNVVWQDGKPVFNVVNG